ncbi:MAG: excinuclease ABC subunit UvrC [Candidatus Paceibacterota bacterium]|jgi:excinuclease ABC subunit C
MTKEIFYKNLPLTPGVYLMKNKKGEIIYVGKAGNLKRRVSSYFQRAGDWKTEKLVNEIKKIDYRKTDTALEALILEADLIKKYQPKYNVLEKDDRSFLYVVITKEEFPRLVLARGKDIKSEKDKYSKIYGPFVSARSVREALKIIRRIFPWNTHDENFLKQSNNRPCFDFQIGNCPGVCVGEISKKDYQKTVKQIELFFAGKKKKIIQALNKEMKIKSRGLEFEAAEKIHRQIFGLQHINDIAFINENQAPHSPFYILHSTRIEGYDISNISGTSAVGSMVVFSNNKPDKNEYRKFKIKTVKGANDVGMLKEVLTRRFKNNWPQPQLILIDGGVGQINSARKVLKEFNLKIPMLGIVKGPQRKNNFIIGNIPSWTDRKTLIQIRDEAHRFAISYHKNLRSKQSLT